MLSRLFSLSISSLRKLDEEANKFYDTKLDLYEAVPPIWERGVHLVYRECFS